VLTLQQSVIDQKRAITAALQQTFLEKLFISDV
jgi:hypothetical protein